MNNYNILDFLTLVITISGFYFAYFQWYKTNRERKFHLLKVLKVQLDCLGPWVGSTGDGYGNDLTEEQKFDNADPSKVVYLTGSTPLIDSTLLEQMSDVPEDIIGEISQLYYDFKRIESIQEYRNLLTSSDIKLSLTIKRKHRDAIYNLVGYNEFIKLLSKNEKDFVQLLVSYGKTLHCDVIGNKSRSARQHWEKLQEWVKNEMQSYKNPQLTFISLSFISFLGLCYATNLYFSLSINYVCLFILCLLVTFLTSINSRAIIITNEPK